MFLTDDESSFIEEVGSSAPSGDRLVDGTGNPFVDASGDNFVTGSTTPP